MAVQRILTFALLLLSAGCDRSGPPVADVPASLRASGTVTVEIVTADGVETFHLTDVLQGTTVEAVMRRIDGLPIEITGSGTTAFVERIGGKSASGDEGWIYEVDGESAQRGIGVTKLSVPAKVTWRYGSE